MGIGVFIAFAANPDSVINDSTGELAGLTEKLYFVSNTISSLGYGDWVPSRFPWTLIATLSTLAATIILTISLSYVLSVVSAVVTKRKLAQGIFSMGKTVPEIIERARLSDPEETLKTHVLSLSSEMDHQSLKHLAYPILKYFHAGSADLSPARAVLLLSDTSFILGTAKKTHRPPPGVLQLMESSISNYLEFSRIRKKEINGQTSYPQRLLDAERNYGIVSPDDAEFKQTLDKYLPLRNRLVALCREDGWNEEFK
ncbi:MAG: ion channel [Balneolales bacterium]